MMTINNIEELKDFVLNSKVSLKDKIEIVNLCLNVIIIGSIESKKELIMLVDKNKNNKDKLIVLGKGINPLDRELIYSEMKNQPEIKRIFDELEKYY
ncbi:hypothetical protein ACRASX_10030 [Flavobacterium sp. TMP13]|uniref:hypothetical protein n=1 Tax=Flavobacterium sp. TMP13 TaxID=3425950 RepID=UPI003D776F58